MLHWWFAEGGLIVWSVEKGVPPPSQTYAISILFFFFSSIREQGNHIWWGGGDVELGALTNHPLGECVGYLLDFTSLMLIYTHFKTKKKNSNHLASLPGS